MKNYFKFENSTDIGEKFREYINKKECSEIIVDLDGANIFDAMKFLVLSSAYHFQKYPTGKMKCLITSEDIKNAAMPFCTANLELI